MDHIARNRTQFRDPFGRDPPPKAFYHPSKQKQLKKKEREIALSPNRHESGAAKLRSPGDELFLKGTNAFSIRTPPSKDDSGDQSSPFDETWPSSERPSYTSVVDSDSASPVSGRPSDMMDSLAYLKATLGRSEKQDHSARRDVTAKSESMDKSVSKGSVLQSYIERFRHGAPMSREERARMDKSGKQEFWWLSHHPPTPSDTSTPKDEDKPRSRQFTHQGKLDVTSAEQSGSLPLTARTLRALDIDEKTRRLQERADRLLEESTSSLHSCEPAVSTDGLGSSSNGTVSSLEEIPYRPAFTRTVADPALDTAESRFPVRHSVKPSVLAARGPLKPEEDILYQWRLRRKMEVAQQGQVPGVKATGTYLTKDVDSKLDAFRRRLEGSMNTGSGVRSSATLNFTPAPASNVEKKVDAEVQTRKSLETIDTASNKNVHTPPRNKKHSKPEIASPTLTRHKLSPRNIDPHLHLMCDLLPCPHAEKYSEKFSNLYETSSDISESDGLSRPPSHVQYKQYLQAEKPHSEEKRGKRKENTRMSREHREHRELDQTVKTDDDSSNSRPNRAAELADTETSDQEEKADSSEGRQLQQSNLKKSDRKKVRITEEVDFDERRRTEERWKSKTNVDKMKDREGKSDQGEFKGRRLDGSQERVARDKTVTRTSASSKGSVPGPVHSSSPARQQQSVSSAIGQTVSEHLFDGSTSAVISSVDSWASLTDNIPPSPSHQPPVHQPPVSHSLGETDKRKSKSENQETTEESYESDGEFPDDHILKMLRHQRGEYEIKLRQIDDLLQQSSFGQK